MNVYVINLPSDAKRKAYIQDVLRKQEFGNISFVEAIYGKSLAKHEKERLFDGAAFTRKYAKIPNDAQIGCTLSHRKCYERFLESGEDCCLVFEDDIVPKSKLLPYVAEVQQFIESSKVPVIVLLSGWFWYTKKLRTGNIALGSLYTGFLSHSYMMNARAARLLLEKKPYYVADDWHEFGRKFGISVYGLIPHIVNQKWDGEFTSSTESLSIPYERGFLRAKCALRFEGLVRKMLTLVGRYERAE